MTVRVLGPLDTGAGQLSPRERAVFAALIVRLGTAVAPSELAEAYWGDAPPTTWAQQVKTSIARIRQRLGSDAVATRGSEYAAGIEPDMIDAVRFERLVSTARQHGLHGDDDRAIDSYQRALILWRGSAYPELRDWEPAAIEAMRLEEIRRSAEEELLEARVRSGEHRAVIPLAERLVREAPLREDRWAVLALANYRAGRQAEALATVRAARERLLDELGIEPGARLRSLETAILRHDPSLDPVTPLRLIDQDCPYPGLASYGPDDADRFFGRDDEVDDILERVRPGTVTAIAGPSGSGKSSVLLAGVLPRLVERGLHVESVRPGSGGGATMRRIADDASGVDVVAFDQAEELLTMDAGDRDALAAAAAAFIERGGCLLLTIRSDFLDDAAALPDLGPAIARGVYLLGPLSRSGMREAIREPAERAGLRIEPGVVELVLRDAADRPTALPAMSHALQETWVRREGVTLTVDGYEAAGGLTGAIAQSAEDLFQTLDEHDGAACRALMLRLIERTDEGTSVRRRVPLAPLVEDPTRRQLIDALIASRLVAVDGPALVVTHEAVATAWPRLAGWLDEHAEDARMVQHVTTAADAWDAGGRRDDDLLRGARLQAALDWAADAERSDLTDVERAFLAASDERWRAEVDAVTRQAARDRQQNRRLRWTLGAAGALLVVALVAGGIAGVQGREAAAAASDQTIEATTSRAIALVDSNRTIASLMAVESYLRWPDDVRTRDALMTVMTDSSGYVGTLRIPGAEERISGWPIGDTGEILVIRDQVNAEVYDLDTGRLVRTLDLDLPMPKIDFFMRPWVRVSDDGSTLAVMQHWNHAWWPDREERLYFFDLATGSTIGEPVRSELPANGFSISPDGRFVAWDSDSSIVVADRDSGARRSRDLAVAGDEPTAAGKERSVAAAIDSKGVLHASTDLGVLLTLNPATLETTTRLSPEGAFGGLGIAIAEDGTIVSMSYADGVSAISPTGDLLWNQRWRSGEFCTHLTASAAADLAACSGEVGQVLFWALSDGAEVLNEFDYQAWGAGDLAVVDEGRELLLFSNLAPQVGRFRIDGSGPASTLTAPGRTTSAWVSMASGYSPSGELMLLQSLDASLAGEDDLHLEVWDVAASARVFSFDEDVLDPPIGDFFADVRWITDQLVAVWDVDLFFDSNGESTGELVRVRVLDLTTGHFVETGLPDDTWDLWQTQDGSIWGIQRRPAEGDAETPAPSYFSGELFRFDPVTLETSARFPLPREVSAEQFWVETTPDGSEVAVLLDLRHERYAFLFDSESGEIVARVPTDAASMTVDGEGHLLFGSDDGVTEVDPATGESVGHFALPGRGVDFDLAHESGMMVATGGPPSTVTVGDVAARQAIGGPIRNVILGSYALIAPDGSDFIVPTRNGVVEWTLDPAAHAEAACRIAARDLTRDEWTSYLGALGEWRPTCDVLAEQLEAGD